MTPAHSLCILFGFPLRLCYVVIHQEPIATASRAEHNDASKVAEDAREAAALVRSEIVEEKKVCALAILLGGTLSYSFSRFLSPICSSRLSNSSALVISTRLVTRRLACDDDLLFSITCASPLYRPKSASVNG